MSYYNTTGVSGHQLDLFTKSAMAQKEAIYLLLKANVGRFFTAWEVEAHFQYPITSVRRALTTLYNNGDISMRPILKISGPYKRPCWSYGIIIAKPYPQPEADAEKRALKRYRNIKST